MPTPEKEATVAQLREHIGAVPCAIACNYRGLRVAEINELRRLMRERDVDFRVVKNRLMKIAVGDTAAATLAELLSGPTALAFCEDPVPAAKTLVEFASEHEVISIKGGIVDGELYSGEQVRRLAELPPRPLLLAQLLGGFNAPVAGLVHTLRGILSEFVFTLHAIADEQAVPEQ
ncbi:MAG: 50S ribosomal protein L10 [Armatimonadota bacterium]|jgi:large subunit ribosomal protein L10